MKFETEWLMSACEVQWSDQMNVAKKIIFIHQMSIAGLIFWFSSNLCSKNKFKKVIISFIACKFDRNLELTTRLNKARNFNEKNFGKSAELVDIKLNCLEGRTREKLEK